MSDSDLQSPSSGPHHGPADSPQPPDPALTPMERFFDNLFNHHMVAPAGDEAPRPDQTSPPPPEQD